MKFRNPKTKLTLTPMRAVITRMINELMPVSDRNSNEVINDVPNELQAGIDENILASTLTTLVNAVISDTRNSSIRVTAQKHHDLILLHIGRNGSFNFSKVSESLLRIQPLAEKMNGYIGITTYMDNTTTIAFSFENIFRNS